ncbi:MAG: hypothetical protein U0Z53_11090 [Blastocatellia bacterium]
MTYQLRFTTIHHYDTLKSGITLPVLLRSGSAEIRVDTKLDTGASFSIFQRLIGEKLGLDIEDGILERVGSVRGSFPAYGHEITLIVLGIEVTATVYFAAEKNFPINVLGRQGWLDRVRLGLVDYEGRLYLSDYNDSV